MRRNEDMARKLYAWWKDYQFRLQDRLREEAEHLCNIASNAGDDAVEAACKEDPNISGEEKDRIREEAHEAFSKELEVFYREWKENEILVAERLFWKLFR